MRAFIGISGDVFVGLMPTMTRATLSPAIQRVVSKHPNMKIHVTESYSPILIQKVMAAELDFAVVPAFTGSRGLKVQHFLRTWESLVARPNNKLHLRRTRLRDVGPLKIVLPSHANARRGQLETYFATNGVAIECVVEMDAMMGTLDLVANSDWVTIIPALMMTPEIDTMQFSVAPLVDPTAPLDLVVIEPMRRTLRPTGQAFLEILREESGRLNKRWRPYYEQLCHQRGSTRSEPLVSPIAHTSLGHGALPPRAISSTRTIIAATGQARRSVTSVTLPIKTAGANA